MDRLALQGLGLLSSLSPLPLSQVVNMAVGAMSPPPPTDNPLVDALAKGYKAVSDVVTGTYFDIVVQGLENVPPDGAVIIIGNHPSLLDGHLLHYALPRAARFIVHKAWAHHPLLKWVSDSMGYLPAENNKEVVHSAERALGQGDVMAVFPEGWVFDPNKVRDYKPGAAVMALHTGAPVVPFGIAGSDKALARNGVLQPASVCLSFGKPLQYPAEPGEHLDLQRVEEVLTDMRTAIQNEVAAAQKTLDTRRDPRDPVLVGVADMLIQPVHNLLSMAVPKPRSKGKKRPHSKDTRPPEGSPPGS